MDMPGHGPAGTPYTPVDVYDEVTLAAVSTTPTGSLNSRYGPWTSTVDLKVNKGFGIAGFGLYSPYLLGYDDEPIVRSEITWNTIIGGWNEVFADDFRKLPCRYCPKSRLFYRGHGLPVKPHCGATKSGMSAH